MILTFIGSSGSASVPSSEGHKANDNEDDVGFDAALEKRRNGRKKKKTEQHPKLGRLVDVAARPECCEEELGRPLKIRLRTKPSSRVQSGKR